MPTGDVTVESSSAVAAVLEDALFEERRELTDGVFGQMETAVFIGPQWRTGGRQHHPEQVPQVTLQKAQNVNLFFSHI